MANLQHMEFVRVESEWSDYHDSYTGNDGQVREATMKQAWAVFKGQKGERRVVLRVNSEEIGGRLQAGTVYNGYMFPAEKDAEGKVVHWAFTVRVKDNEHLGKGGGQPVGAPPSSPQSAPAATSTPQRQEASVASYTIQELKALSDHLAAAGIEHGLAAAVLAGIKVPAAECVTTALSPEPGYQNAAMTQALSNLPPAGDLEMPEAPEDLPF